MKVVLVNLSNEVFAESRQRLNESAQKFGIADVVSYSFEQLRNTQFFKENSKILEQPRGLGFWSWKPYIILEAMQNIKNDDVVIYADCGLEIIADLSPLIQIAKSKSPVLLFANGNLINADWTKRDCFIEMDCDNSKFWYGSQVDAAFSIYKKSDFSIRFLKDWLFYCKNEYALTDLPNIHKKRNIPGFIQHRWDQSILSLLAIKYDLELYRIPTQFGNHYKSPTFRIAGEFNCKNQQLQKPLNYYSKNYFANSSYFQLLDHHRSKIGEKSDNKQKHFDEKIKRFFEKRFVKLSVWIHRLIYK